MTKNNIPTHVAIIMDGNGRWAAKRNLPHIMGHKAGSDNVERVMDACRDAGVKILTLYAFSTENWKRSHAEVKALMKLLESYLDDKTMKLKKEGVKLITIGDKSKLPEAVQEKLDKAIDVTKDNTQFVLNLALNYGARSEIINAVKNVSKDLLNEELALDDLDEKMFSKYLYTKGLPDPELLIRTSGEMRISNFLLWQISYSEIYVTEKFWPDFDKDDFLDAVKEYQARERRFGGRK